MMLDRARYSHAHSSFAPPVRPELLEHYPGRAGFFVYQNVLIAVWLDAANGPVMDRFGAAVSKVRERRFPGTSVINWLTPGRPMPDQEARIRLVRMANSFESRVACVSVILNGSGFWAGAIRAMVNGIALLIPSSMDIRVDGALTHTTLWLPAVHSKRTGWPITGMAVRSAVLESVEMTEQLRG